MAKSAAAESATSTTADTLAGWRFEKDAYGDWRGYSSDGWYRTRLKFSREWAAKDADAGRLQVRRGAEWVDQIDGPRNHYTMPVED